MILSGILALLGGFFGGFASELLRHILDARTHRADRADQALGELAPAIRDLDSALMSVFPAAGDPIAASEKELETALDAAQALNHLVREYEPMLVGTASQIGLGPLDDHVIDGIRLVIRAVQIRSDPSLPPDEARVRLSAISKDYEAFQDQSERMLTAIAYHRSRLQGFRAPPWQFWRR